MKRNIENLFHLTGEYADRLVYGELFDYVEEASELSDTLNVNEYITDEEDTILAQRFRYCEWNLTDNARENQDTFRAVMLMTVMTVMVERRN